MALLRNVFALWLGLTAPAFGHEFWIEPRAYSIPQDTDIEADLLVGTNFVGQDYVFIPRGYELAKFVRPGGTSDLEFTGQDNPALSLATAGAGLHSIVLISKSSTLTHDDFAAFSAFAQEVGRSSEIASARREGPIREAYFRYAKALIGVGNGTGADRAHGAVYEWIALDNPYTTADGPLKFQLRLNGEPAPDEPVQVFARDPISKGDAEPVHFRTDAEGVFSLPERFGGEIMLNSVKLLQVRDEEMDWVSYWASITFAR